jgi:hypothetical protein
MDLTDYLPNKHKYNTRYKKNMMALSNSKLEPLKFQLFLTKIFPSKYMHNKSKLLLALNNSKLKKNIIKKNKRYNSGTKQKQKQNTPDNSSESEDDEDEDDDECEDEDEDECEDEDEDECEEDDEDDEDDECEEEDDECEEEDNECEEDDDECENLIIKRKFLDKLLSIANKKKKSLNSVNKNKGSKEKEFKELINVEDNLNDIKYFTKELDEFQKNSIIEELKKINSKFKIYKPYRILLLEMNIPTDFKIVALKKIGMLETMNPSASEYFKLKSWIDSFMSLPFNKINNSLYRSITIVLCCKSHLFKHIIIFVNFANLAANKCCFNCGLSFNGFSTDITIIHDFAIDTELNKVVINS